MTYKLTLVHKMTAELLVVDIEQSSAFAAQSVASETYSDYRTIKIQSSVGALLDADYRHTEGALGDDLDF